MHSFLNRQSHIAVWLTGLVVAGSLVTGPPNSRAQTLDRMMAVVDGRVITLSDVLLHRDLARLFGDPVPVDDGEALSRIIENMLIDTEISRFSASPVSESDVGDLLATIDDVEDIPVERVRDAARARLVREEFFETRFGRFRQASPQAIEAYYRTVFLPAARSEGLEPLPPLDDVLRPEIARNVVIEETERAIRDWVESLVERNEIEVVD